MVDDALFVAATLSWYRPVTQSVAELGSELEATLHDTCPLPSGLDCVAVILVKVELHADPVQYNVEVESRAVLVSVTLTWLIGLLASVAVPLTVRGTVRRALDPGAEMITPGLAEALVGAEKAAHPTKTRVGKERFVQRDRRTLDVRVFNIKSLEPNRTPASSFRVVEPKEPRK